ncbi:MAG: cob(I)yrinic acid a,c-diamide adenosyltransferase [Armatimonadetes bacterium]|nr:cob(I)yrinic acid a,c-diamide adenosyltransferase [Armatimonadota bacterium]
MKIYTKTGDGGQTGLPGGARVNKSDPICELLGEVDELNASIGSAIVDSEGSAVHTWLQKLQPALFELGSEISTGSGESLPKLADLTADMERWMDEHDAKMQPLKNFILPGGCRLAADLHVARTVCRRAERSIVRYSTNSQVDSAVLSFVNRLSDWLFMAARFANHEAGQPDIIWKRN